MQGQYLSLFLTHPTPFIYALMPVRYTSQVKLKCAEVFFTEASQEVISQRIYLRICLAKHKLEYGEHTATEVELWEN